MRIADFDSFIDHYWRSEPKLFMTEMSSNFINHPFWSIKIEIDVDICGRCCTSYLARFHTTHCNKALNADLSITVHVFGVTQCRSTIYVANIITASIKLLN